MISFLAVLSVLVLVHEFGHFIVAKRLGVRVEKFSFGFGPKIFSVKRGETEYLLSAILLGGYVKMAGDEPWENRSHKKWEFLSRSVADRFKIIAAGPALNYLLAFLVFSVIFLFGSPTLTTEVGGLLDGYPAKAAGITAGDVVLSVDGSPVRYWEEMTEAIHKRVDGDIALSIDRGGRVFEAKIRPTVRATKDIFGNETRMALVGITPSQKIGKERYPFPQCFLKGAEKLWQLTSMTFKALWAIVVGKMSMKESLTGPIGIFVITGQAAKMGFIYILHLMGILSASLAIFNVLPIPVLDGGHMVFLLIERLRGKPLSLKAQETISNVGVALLIMLTVFIFYNDAIKFGILGKAAKIFQR